MIQMEGDLWDFHNRDYHVVIPTNLETRRNGSAIMGRGVARQAVDKFPGLEAWYGRAIWEHNHTDVKYNAVWRIFCFPVKSHWRDRADLDIIKNSAASLRRSVEAIRVGGRIPSVALPLVGCGFGELDPEQVLPILEDAFLGSDTFTLVRRSGEVNKRYAASFRPGARIDRS